MSSPNAPPDGGSDLAPADIAAGEFLDRAFFRSLVDNGSDAIVTINEDSEILYANRATERVFGHSPDALVGEPLTTIMPERFHDGHHEAIAAYVRTGVRKLDWSGIQLPARHASGEEIQLDITFEEHRYEGERVFSGIMRDVTERVERTRRLERQTEQLEQFASVVSHDLRDPLQAAKAGLALARSRASDDVDDTLGEVETRLDRMNELIEDVLELAKRGRAIGETERVELRSVAGSAWETVGTDAATLAFADPPGAVEADEERLLALFENLLGNAVEHGGPDVRVEVGGLDGAGFYVADDGPGFGAVDPDRLFDHGYTGSDAGTGFGLSIVEGIAAAHGWTVTATEDEDRNGGARFEVTGVSGA
jgi:PAS domain S-box-containing protein